MDTKEYALNYYRQINAKSIDGVLGLFADGASFNLPDGRKVEGMDAIRKMYEGVFAHGGPQPQPVFMVPGENAVAVEVEVNLADGSKRLMASFFEIDDSGKFSRIAVYRRD